MNYAIYPLIFDGSIQSLVNYPPLLSDLDLFQCGKFLVDTFIFQTPGWQGRHIIFLEGKV